MDLLSSQIQSPNTQKAEVKTDDFSSLTQPTTGEEEEEVTDLVAY